MTNKSPFADFYNNVFSKSSPAYQEAYLRELFTKNGALCSSYYTFITDDQYAPDRIENYGIEIKEKTSVLQQKIQHFKWGVLWEKYDNPENYDEDLIALLEEKFIGSNQFPIRSMCSNGELLKAVASLRIIELGLNIDWEKVAEPARYYGREVGYFIGYQLDDFHSSFVDAVFSVVQIRDALALIASFKNNPGAFFNHTEGWERLEDFFREEVAGRRY